MIWNEAMETMDRQDIEDLQAVRLQDLVKRVCDAVPFYKNKFDEANLQPGAVKDLSSLSRLPFTVKDDLRDHYPFALFAEPMNRVVRLHASSGTTGKPTVVGYTREDLDIWAEVCARSLALAGGKPGEMFQNAYGYGLFTGGLGMHYGAEKMGMTVIPVSGGNTGRQILLIRDFGPHMMACTPSYALTLVDRLRAEKVDPESINLKTFLLGAEPWTEEMRSAIEARFPVKAVNIYGLSEIIGPGVSNECIEARDGSHVFEDHFIVEAINPNTGQPVPDGKQGELVFTTLTKQAMPLIRYRTGDLASINRTPCICGRTHARMSRITGRVDDMLIIRGVNVFPSQIESVIVAIPQLSPHHLIEVSREQHLEQLTIKVEIAKDLGDETSLRQTVSTQAIKGLKEILGINVKLSIQPQGSIPRSEGGKLNRVVRVQV